MLSSFIFFRAALCPCIIDQNVYVEETEEETVTIGVQNEQIPMNPSNKIL